MLAGTLALGEVSLSGELRRVPRLEARLREAAQMGFARAGFPLAQKADAEGAGLELVPLSTLREACERLLGEKLEVPRPEGAAPRAEQRPGEQAAGPTRARPASSAETPAGDASASPRGPAGPPPERTDP